MPTLSTGLVIAGAYADKVRRTLFAQLKGKIKAGEVPQKEVARASGELNRFIYYVLVDKLRADKGDVVRIKVSYDIKEGKVSWDYENISIELWRKEPAEKISALLKEALEILEEIIKWPPPYELEYVTETLIGDKIYLLKIRGRTEGAIIATIVNNDLLVRGAVIEPSPLVIGPAKIAIGERSIDDALKEDLPKLIESSRHTEANEALKVLNIVQAFAKSVKGEEFKII